MVEARTYSNYLGYIVYTARVRSFSLPFPSPLFWFLPMTRSSSSSVTASSLASNLASQGKELLAKLKQTDGLTWAVLAAIVIYVAVASPVNTPTIFRNSLFRFFLFAFVVVVFLVEGPVIGTMFALAMLLPIVYSSMGTVQEGFLGHEQIATNEMAAMLDNTDSEDIDEDIGAEALDVDEEEAPSPFSAPY